MKRIVKPKVVVNNIIDPDKLAEAMLKAELIKKEQEDKNVETNKRMTFLAKLKIIISVILNKKQSNGTMTSGLLGSFVSCLFNSLALFGLLFLWYGGKSVFNTIEEVVTTSGVSGDSIVTVLIRVFILVLIAIFSLIFRAVANEMKEEKDRNYIVTVFSGIVGFAALIVAVIALLKGVG